MTVALTQTQRPHGYARYKLDGCRCYVCGYTRSQYEIRRQKAIAAGTWKPWADAEPVRRHVRKLMAAGIGRRRIANLAAVAQSTVENLIYGRPDRPLARRIRRSVAARLLAIQPCTSAFAGAARIPATATHRRIQALATLGWSLREQAHRIGWTGGNYAALLNRPAVHRTTADKVAALYDEICMRPAPQGYSATRTRNLARERGWYPPLAWDDDLIDDPAATPAVLPGGHSIHTEVDELAIQRFAAGHRDGVAALNAATRCELARRLFAIGWTNPEIATLFGVSKQRIEQMRGEHLAGGRAAA